MPINLMVFMVAHSYTVFKLISFAFMWLTANNVSEHINTLTVTFVT